MAAFFGAAFLATFRRSSSSAGRIQGPRGEDDAKCRWGHVVSGRQRTIMSTTGVLSPVGSSTSSATAPTGAVADEVEEPTLIVIDESLWELHLLVKTGRHEKGIFSFQTKSTFLWRRPDRPIEKWHRVRDLRRQFAGQSTSYPVHG